MSAIASSSIPISPSSSGSSFPRQTITDSITTSSSSHGFSRQNSSGSILTSPSSSHALSRQNSSGSILTSPSSSHALSRMSSSGQLEDSLSCGVCFEKFNSADHLPKILPCQHTFCSWCIDQMSSSPATGKKGRDSNKDEGAGFTCPVCCAPVRGDIRTNLAVRDVVEALSSSEQRDPGDKLPCSLHPSRDSILICLDCNQAICSLCAKELTKGKHQGHYVDEIEEAMVFIGKQIDDAIVKDSADADAYVEEYDRKIKQALDKSKQDVDTIIALVTETLRSWRKEQLLSREKACLVNVAKLANWKEDQAQRFRALTQADVKDILHTLDTIKQRGSVSLIHTASKPFSGDVSPDADVKVSPNSVDELHRMLTSQCGVMKMQIKSGALPQTPLTRTAACQTDPLLLAHPTPGPAAKKKLPRSPVGAPPPPAPLPSDVETLRTVPRLGGGGQVLREVRCDLFALSDVYSLVHCVSADFHMGKGLALEFKKRFKGQPDLLSFKAHTGQMAFLKRGERYVYYLVTKERFNRKPTMWTLESSLGYLREHCVKNNVLYLAMPTIGCGWDRLDWDNVSKLLVDTFMATRVQITVCIE